MLSAPVEDAPVPLSLSILIPYGRNATAAALGLASRVLAPGRDVVLAGRGLGSAALPPGVRSVEGTGPGSAIRSALPTLQSEITILHDALAGADVDYASLAGPIASGEADVVVVRAATGEGLGGLGRAVLGSLSRVVFGAGVRPDLCAPSAVRTEALRTLSLRGEEGAAQVEILVKLAAQEFRFAGVSRDGPAPADSWERTRAQASALLRYGFFQNDADNLHAGYNTLTRMEGAPRYNAWLGRTLRAHLGYRVLEVGAGIGTITREIAPGRERVIALEADPFYVQRLRNRFRNSPIVRPLHAAVEATDWEALGRERLDTVLLSNVLEHIEDDGAAVARFRRVLPEGGRLVLLVPALPGLFGSMDEAVGHFRRYTKEALWQVLVSNGFAVERLAFMNLVGIPGWFLNGRVFRRQAVPPLQLRVYDLLSPALAKLESSFPLPVGMSLLAVGRAVRGAAP